MKSMWKANKRGITTLVMGLIVLGGIHSLVSPLNEQLADQILALGFCLLLFLVGLVSWVSVRYPDDKDGWQQGWDRGQGPDHLRDQQHDIDSD